MKTIVITWKEARHHTIGAQAAGKDAKGTEVSGHGRIRLSPGANVVSYDDWQAAKKLRIIKHFIDAGQLIEGAVVDGEGKSLAEMKPAEAIKLINETLDKARLTGWLESEDRAQVRTAIERRIALIDSQRRDEKSPSTT